MAFKLITITALLFAGAIARPQLPLDDFNNQVNNDLGPINPNPQYTYKYNVASEERQTYISHEENRDGEIVTGAYSYVDANGDLVEVNYEAGPMGYTEDRKVTPKFIEYRAENIPGSSSSSSSSSSGTGVILSNRRTNTRPAPRPVVPQPQPAPRPVQQTVVRQQTTTSSSGASEDLIAQIIAQLTPFIQNAVSTSISNNASGQQQQQQVTTTRRVISSTPVQTQRTISSSQGGSVENIFGVEGASQIQFESPDSQYAFDLAAAAAAAAAAAN